jgi:hypothetical protein
MSDVTITERQQYWLGHLQAAEAFDGPLAEYARSAGLEPKDPVFLAGSTSQPRAARPAGLRASFRLRPGDGSGFCPDHPALRREPGAAQRHAPECHGELGPEQLEALVLAASRLP